MNDPNVLAKHDRICKSEYFRNLQRAISTGRKHSEETKELCRRNTLANLDVCLAGFRAYNESRKVPIGIVDDEGNIIKVFECQTDAVRWICANNPKYKFNSGNVTQIKQYADKFNKNGKRAKFLGCSWTLKV